MKPMRHHRYFFLLHVLFIIILLSGCGGSGGSGGGNPANTDTPATPGTPGTPGNPGTPGTQSSDDYYPSWVDIAPTNTILLDYDPGRSSVENGAILADAVADLQPGDKLEIGAGCRLDPYGG